ncbi:MAG: hypothetical protein ABEJ28_11065 [Salinigranum sp.]
MTNAGAERSLLREAERRLDEWLPDARARAYDDLFAGEEAILAPEEVRVLDRLDDRLTEGGEGLWGTARFGVLSGAPLDEDDGPRVVCTYHPAIPDYAAEAEIDDDLQERLDDALWAYAEAVAAALQADLDRFLRVGPSGSDEGS